jgi:DNA invertase Pin-like site-specific DNA recombinase
MNDGRKTFAQKAVQASTGREPRDLLRELYVDRRHSQEEIARALGISRATVYAWLREYGIDRDDRPALAL